MDLTLLTAGSALFDSLATSQQILILILLFSTARPLVTSGAFLGGLVGAYLACGLVGLSFMDQVNALVKLFVPDLSRLSDGSYYAAEALSGLAFAGGAVAWGIYRERHPKTRGQAWIEVLKRMNPTVAFLVGAFVSASSFPAALPYIHVLGQLAASSLPLGTQWAYVGLYNLVYALPLAVPYGLFVILREGVVPTLHLHADRVTRWLTVALMVALGLFSLADAGTFWATGHGLTADRWL